MGESMNEETRARIEEICEKVSVAHSLDPEIREELRGHMEDKLHAYMSGRETLTEEDALLLVREHFGDPARLKSMFQDAHVVETYVSLARRIVAIACLYLCLVAANSILWFIARSSVAWIYIANLDRLYAGYESLIVLGLLSVLLVGTFIEWRVLLSWERRIRAGKSCWFQRWRAGSIVALSSCIVFISLISPMPSAPAQFYSFMHTPHSPAELPLVWTGVLFITLILQGFLWLWWCDRHPKLPRTLIIATAVWIAVSNFPHQNVQLVQLEMHLFDTTPDISNRMVLWQAQGEKHSVIWTLRPGLVRSHGLGLQNEYSRLFGSLLYSIPMIVFAWYFYRRFDRRREEVSRTIR